MLKSAKKNIDMGGILYNNLAFSIISIGGVGNFMRYVYGDLLAVRPVLYLTSSAKITGGSGTLSSPYTLGL